MKKVSLALSLAGALSGCHTWYAVNPSSVEDLAAARELRVGEWSEGGEDYVRGHQVSEHYARPEVGEDGMVTLRGHVVSYDLTHPPPEPHLLDQNPTCTGCSPTGSLATPPWWREQTVSSSVTYDPARTTVLARRTHVGRIVAATIVFSLVAAGGATAAYVVTR
jgi:hypothetical protein